MRISDWSSDVFSSDLLPYPTEPSINIRIIIMKEAFSNIKKISYEGRRSKSPLTFKHYNAGEVIEGKTMAEHLRFSVAYWHTFRNGCADPFGQPTRLMPRTEERRVGTEGGSKCK